MDTSHPISFVSYFIQRHESSKRILKVISINSYAATLGNCLLKCTLLTPFGKRKISETFLTEVFTCSEMGGMKRIISTYSVTWLKIWMQATGSEHLLYKRNLKGSLSHLQVIQLRKEEHLYHCLDHFFPCSGNNPTYLSSQKIRKHPDKLQFWVVLKNSVGRKMSIFAEEAWVKVTLQWVAAEMKL